MQSSASVREECVDVKRVDELISILLELLQERHHPRDVRFGADSWRGARERRVDASIDGARRTTITADRVTREA